MKIAMTEPGLDRPLRATAGDQAETALFSAIMAGKISPGAPLRLQELADQLGMSIMPVREALRRLESLGLVEIVAHRGAWVRALTLADLHDTYFTRINLECTAIRAAAERFGPDQADEARAALEALLDARARGDQVAERNAHERFHFTLYEASGSEWLIRSLGPAWRNSERYRVASMRDEAHRERRAAEHQAMLDALIRGDGEGAAALLAEHLRSSADLVAAGLEDDDTEAKPPLPMRDLADPVTRGEITTGS
jgi:DNA-binding GntR family transcriptional regulator